MKLPPDPTGARSPPTRCGPLLVFLCLVVAGCGDPSRMADGIDVADLPRLDFEEDLRIGSVDDPDVGFSSIRGVEVAPDGRVAVLDRTDRHVRIYDTEGTLVRVIGRQGSGPGEFELPWSLGLRNDTLWVSDLRYMRLSVFRLDGTLLETVPTRGVPMMQLAGAGVRVVPDQPLGDGRYGSALSVTGQGIAPVDSARVPAFLFDGAGEVVDTVGEHFLPPQGLFQIGYTDANIRLPPPFPFADWPIRIPVGADTVLVRREAPQESPAEFTITRTTSAGDTVYHTRLGYRPVALDPDEVIAAALESFASETVPRRQAEADVRERIPELPFLPPVSGHRAGEDGSIWLKREDAGADTLRWLVIASDGTPRGEVAVPRDVDPMWVSEEVAWTVEPDEFGVPWLVRRRLRP